MNPMIPILTKWNFYPIGGLRYTPKGVGWGMGVGNHIKFFSLLKRIQWYPYLQNEVFTPRGVRGTPRGVGLRYEGWEPHKIFLLAETNPMIPIFTKWSFYPLGGVGYHWGVKTPLGMVGNPIKFFSLLRRIQWYPYLQNEVFTPWGVWGTTGGSRPH